MPRTLRTQPLNTAAQLFELEAAWEALWRDQSVPQPALEPQFVRLWCQHFGNASTLHAFAFWHDTELIGLSLLQRRRVRAGPGVHIARLQAVGGSDGHGDGVWLPAPGVLAADGWEPEVANALVTALSGAEAPRFDDCLLELQPPGPLLEGVVSAATERRIPRDRTIQDTQLARRLPADWPALLTALPKKKRYALRRAETALAERGRLDWHRAATEPERQAGFALLMRLHGARWQHAGQPGVFAASRFSSFHRDYSRHLQAAGRLELQWLTLDDAPIAALYQLRCGNTQYLYQLGREPDLPNALQPGIAAVALAMRDAMANGIDHYDFMLGEAPYKRLFGATPTRLEALRLSGPGARARLLRGLRTVAQRLRKPQS